MSLAKKECPDCESRFQPKRANAKYCGVCRMIRDLLYIAGRRSVCYACDGKYAPLVRRDICCGTCDRSPESAAEGQCGFCVQKGDLGIKKLINADVAACLPCAKDPDQRSLLLKALLAKQSERRDTP